MKASVIPALLVVLCSAPTMPSQAANFPVKLFLSHDGMALSQFPSRKVLKGTIRVTRTFGKGKVDWTASSDQPWLSVTPNGTKGGALALKANTKNLAKDQFYLAKVTVSTSRADFSDSETLRVGLYVGSTDPVTVTFKENGNAIATNPVTPIAYVASGSGIDEYNVYTGALVGSFKKVAPTIGYLEVSSDGNTLFASDTTNYNVVAVDASAGAVLAKYGVGYPNTTLFTMAYVRVFGQPALYLSGYLAPQPRSEGQRGAAFYYGRLIAYPSGADLADGVLLWGPLAATPDGTSVVSTVYGGVTDDFVSYGLSLQNDTLTLRKTHDVGTDGQNCTDIAISRDGKYAFPACGAPYQFDIFDVQTAAFLGALPAAPYPNNIEIDSADRIVGGLDGVQEPYDVYVYNKKGVPIGTVATTAESEHEGQQPGAMKVSGDGTRVISITWDVSGMPQTLMFRNMP
jgi:hypothetical protein